MPIRRINKYTVINRFSLGKKLYDKLDTVYVQEHDPINKEPQKVFNGEKEYVTEISSDVYLSLRTGFMIDEQETPLDPKNI